MLYIGKELPQMDIDDFTVSCAYLPCGFELLSVF
jgi:hypothetical protein